nr:uncharacterized protein LOC100183165 [Ciona intestinalis]XP_018668922.1 uncharacterized protein LOC100183165 [Ciona intestinalis]XP_018668923.1 uncharacterized protein LOC100183165 [Ciona intestinalis]|eukprot:XP_002130114.1 uncharacterized protein LOC100183165 [Ciona intestinalis]
MPETDRLAKLIEHRKQQEKKNDKLRIHRNKLENDRLVAQESYLDWNKKLREKEFTSAETEYMRKLERIYDRQLNIQDERKKIEEKKAIQKKEKKKKLETESMVHEVTEEERLRQLFGVKQEKAKFFMTKAKTLSGGYRDNDPPQAYYKRNGLVPPDRLVTPEMSAAAQASLGGGSRPPSSSNHLNKPTLPAETPFGVTEKRPASSKRRRPASRSRIESNISEVTAPLMSSDEESTDTAIEEVIRVQVNLRPSTAPGKRKKPRAIKESGMVTTVEEEEGRQRPSTAAAFVRFGEAEKIGEEEQRGLDSPEDKSPKSPGRRRQSLKAPNMLLFRRRPSGVSGGPRSAVSAPTTPRGHRGSIQQTMMSNVQQDRIRIKMLQKARCLQQERIRRELLRIAATKPDVKTETVSRDVPLFPQKFKTLPYRTRTKVTVPPRDPQSAAQRDAMLSYVQRCERGYIMGDIYEAKQQLLDATTTRTLNLQAEVESFVKV